MIVRCFLLIGLLCSCSPSAENEVNGKLTEVEIFQSEYGGFGYNIHVNGKLVIHQPNIPALPGNKGFTTEKSATQVAALVVEKLKKNQMPPTVSVDEVNAAMRD